MSEESEKGLRLYARITKIEIYCAEEANILHFRIPPMGKMVKTTSVPYVQFPKFIEEKEDILKFASRLKNSFEDLQDRQINFTLLKSSLRSLRNKVSLDTRGFLRAIDMCLDVLDNARSELLTIKQVEKLQFVLGQMNEQMDELKVNELQHILLDSGLKPTPSLEGIARAYQKL